MRLSQDLLLCSMIASPSACAIISLSQMHGEIPGVAEGETFRSRAELSLSQVHRPPQAGICGTATSGGAESIVLNGGYEDDLDEGDVIVYTGHGSNDPRTGKQVGDQVLSPQNAGLIESVVTGLPVRVIRGSKGDPIHSPSEGYRYDGLYRVEETWWEQGRCGFNVIRCRLVKIDPTRQVPITQAELPGPDLSVKEPPRRTEVTTQRIIRDTAVGRKVKNLYSFECQRCGTTIESPVGRYAECAHVVPLGRPHDGLDDLSNVLCLCPNCHVSFDLGMWYILDDLTISPTGERLNVHRNHGLSASSIRYRRQLSAPGS